RTPPVAGKPRQGVQIVNYTPLDDELPHGNDRRYPIAMVIVVVLGILLIAWNGTIGLTLGLLWLLPIVIAIHLGVSRDRSGCMWAFSPACSAVLTPRTRRPRRREVTHKPPPA